MFDLIPFFDLQQLLLVASTGAGAKGLRLFEIDNYTK